VATVQAGGFSNLLEITIMPNITKLLTISACALMLSAMVAPESNPFIGSAYAQGGGGGGGGAGGGGGGGAGGGGAGGGGAGGGAGGRGGADGGGTDGSGGLGVGRANEAAGLGAANGKAEASRSDNRGATTSAVAKSDETTGLAKAMAVVASTPAALAAALGLQSAADKQAAKDLADEPATVGSVDAEVEVE
jgi:hypothetical protein